MSLETTVMAVQYRLHECEAQIRDCQNQLTGMSVANWYACNGITKASYYYRFRCARVPALKNFLNERTDIW